MRRGQWHLYCKLQYEMCVFFVSSILSSKLRHILAVQTAPNRLYCKLQYEMRVFVLCLVHYDIFSLCAGANGVYIANYNMKCVSFFATSILPCKLRHILAVRSAPNRVAGGSPARRRRVAVAPPLRQCLSYHAGLLSGVRSGRIPVRGQWRLYFKL